jgi:hypothetical protein
MVGVGNGLGRVLFKGECLAGWLILLGCGGLCANERKRRK